MWDVPQEEDDRLIGYLRQGMRLADVATTMQMPYQTIKSRIARLYRKYGVHNRHQLLASVDDSLREDVLRPDVVTLNASQHLRHWTGLNGTTDAIHDALELAYHVRVGSPAQLRMRIRRWSATEPARLEAAVLALAALLPLDQSPETLLRWLTERHRSVAGPVVRPVGRVNQNGRQTASR